jgi:hypothetical protein
MDDGLPEIIRQRRAEAHQDSDPTAPDVNSPVHEGDSILFVQLSRMAFQAKQDAQKTLVREKTDTAYVRYAITLDQWASIYNILNGLPPETPLASAPPVRDDECVYPTSQTIANRQHGIV